MTALSATSLWSDWCVVTRTPENQRDEATLAQFARDASPPRRMLDRLRLGTTSVSQSAPAWPFTNDLIKLESVLNHLSRRDAHPDTHWVTRLRLRRLAFVAVLVAPVEQGGLARTRQEVHDLAPEDLHDPRATIGSSTGEWSCPSCSVWSWLEVLGTDNGWSHHSMRALAHRPLGEEGSPHRCSRTDPSPDWLDCRRLLPAVDRWGYLDPYSSMHISSISVLLQALPLILDQLATETPPNEQEVVVRRPATRTFTPEEETEVFARADQLNARVAKILAEA